MDSVTFQIVRASDRDTIGALKGLASEDIGAAKLIVNYLTEGNHEVPFADIDSDSLLKTLTTSDTRLFRNIVVQCNGGQASIKRHLDGDAHRDNNHPFDVVTISAVPNDTKDPLPQLR